MRTPVRSTIWLATLVVVLAFCGEWFLAAVYGENEVRCDQASVPVPLPALPEASGIAASRRTTGLLWAVNDSSPAVLFGLNDAGDVLARVQVTGAKVTDWEDLSVGRCAQGSCLYIADIGDNDERRASIRVYRVPEPSAGDARTSDVEVFEARYPDRPHDAEAAFVAPDGSLYIVTKETLAGGLYRYPALETGTTVTLERVAMLPISKITDADTSADGTWLAVRSGDEAVFYRTDALLKGDVEHGAAILLKPFDEPQGEGITFRDRETVFLGGEGGKKNVPGTLRQLRCRFP